SSAAADVRDGEGPRTDFVFGQFEATKWSIDDEGILTPIMQVKQKRWYESRAAVVPFQPETEMRHRRIGECHDPGHTPPSASLRLKPGSSTVSPPKAPR